MGLAGPWVSISNILQVMAVEAHVPLSPNNKAKEETTDQESDSQSRKPDYALRMTSLSRGPSVSPVHLEVRQHLWSLCPQHLFCIITKERHVSLLNE